MGRGLRGEGRGDGARELACALSGVFWALGTSMQKLGVSDTDGMVRC